MGIDLRRNKAWESTPSVTYWQRPRLVQCDSWWRRRVPKADTAPPEPRRQSECHAAAAAQLSARRPHHPGVNRARPHSHPTDSHDSPCPALTPTNQPVINTHHSYGLAPHYLTELLNAPKQNSIVFQNQSSRFHCAWFSGAGKNLLTKSMNIANFINHMLLA